MAEETSKTKPNLNEIRAEIRRKKHRSPNYPCIDLKKAVERATQIYEKYKRNVVPIGLVQEIWGYKQHSGIGNQVIAAIKAFGLLEVDGEAESRKIRLSDSAYRLMLNSNDRSEILKDAAIAPALFREIWEKYSDQGIPDNELLRHYLTLERTDGTFNPETVDDFIANFKDSLRFAGLETSDIMNDKGAESSSGKGREIEIQVGNHVQWTSNGTNVFDSPRRVSGFSDDREWAFVEGNDTGIAVEELAVVNQGAEEQAKKPTPKSPPANPFKADSPKAKRDEQFESWAGPKVRFDLPRGNVIEIRLKTKVSQQEFQKIKKIFDLSELAFLEDGTNNEDAD